MLQNTHEALRVCPHCGDNVSPEEAPSFAHLVVAHAEPLVLGERPPELDEEVDEVRHSE